MAVALMSQVSSPSCEFLVQCEGFQLPDLEEEQNFLMQVSWMEQTAQSAARVWSTEQPKPIVERASVGLAALAFSHLLTNGQMRVTEEGDRADYWLPKLSCALEISGTQQKREVVPRRRQKLAQMLENPRQWNGYLFVCYFGKTSRLINWSYHTQEERDHGAS